MRRRAKAVWRGTGLEGQGVISTPQSGVFDNHPYSFKTRFQNEDGTLGTNPEELIAAAHAACFNMALSFQLSGAGHEPEELKTDALLTMEKEGEGWVIKSVHLTLKAKVDINKEEFDQLVDNAKNGCPISQVLNCEITLESTLV
jgi:osmotically inducible protein OsmC